MTFVAAKRGREREGELDEPQPMLVKIEMNLRWRKNCTNLRRKTPQWRKNCTNLKQKTPQWTARTLDERFAADEP